MHGIMSAQVYQQHELARLPQEFIAQQATEPQTPVVMSQQYQAEEPAMNNLLRKLRP
jgi:phosphotransferase system IIA component